MMNKTRPTKEFTTPNSKKRPRQREHSISSMDSDSNDECDTAINVLRNSVDGLQKVMEDFVKEQTERIHKLRTELNTLEKHRFDEKRKRTRRKCNEIIMGNTTGEVSTSSPQPLYLPTPPVPAKPLILTLPTRSTRTAAAESQRDVSPLLGRSSGRNEAMHLTARQREKLPLRRSPDPTDDEDEIQPLSSRAPMSGQSFDSVSTLGYEFPVVNNQTASISGDPFLSSPSPVENDEESAPWQSSRTLRTKETKNYDVAAKFSAMFEFETLSQKAKTEKELAQLNEDKVQSPCKAEYSPEKPSDAEKHKAKSARKRGPKPKKRPAPRYSSNEACSPMAGTKVFATKMTLERRMQLGQSKLDHFRIS